MLLKCNQYCICNQRCHLLSISFQYKKQRKVVKFTEPFLSKNFMKPECFEGFKSSRCA